MNALRVELIMRTAARLSTILQDYMNRLERFGTERPMSLVVITDGRELSSQTQSC